MSDILQWNPVDDNNNQSPPNGFPEGMNYSQVNNAARAIMGGIARWNADNNGTLTTTGTGNAYVLTTNQDITAYQAGITLVFRADRINTGAATLTLNGLSALPLRREDGQDIGANEITQAFYQVVCDGAQFIVTGTASSVDEITIDQFPALADNDVTLDNINHTQASNGNDSTQTNRQILALINNFLGTEIAQIDAADGHIMADTSDNNNPKKVTFENYYAGRENDVPDDGFVLILRANSTPAAISESNFLTNYIQPLVDARIEANLPSISGNPANGEFQVGTLQFRMGQVTSNTDALETFTFSTPFANSCIAVVLNRQAANATNPTFASAFGATGFSIDRADAISSNDPIQYIAIGY